MTNLTCSKVVSERYFVTVLCNTHWVAWFVLYRALSLVNTAHNKY